MAHISFKLEREEEAGDNSFAVNVSKTTMILICHWLLIASSLAWLVGWNGERGLRVLFQKTSSLKHPDQSFWSWRDQRPKRRECLGTNETRCTFETFAETTTHNIVPKTFTSISRWLRQLQHDWLGRAAGCFLKKHMQTHETRLKQPITLRRTQWATKDALRYRCFGNVSKICFHPIKTLQQEN